MAHYSKIFTKAPVQVQNLNGFDLGHKHVFSAKVGTLVPAVCHPVIPGTKIKYGFNSTVQLPPMATDFYGTINACVEAFFVPNRILFGGWQDFITHPTEGYSSSYPPGSTSAQMASHEIPRILLPYGSFNAGSLADYLGFKSTVSSQQGMYLDNPLPFLAYQKIYDDWFRDSRLQKSAFIRPTSVEQLNHRAKHAPWFFTSSTQNNEFTDLTLNDGHHLYSLRQRNWPKDYFTNATLDPQSGQESVLSFNVEVTDDADTGTSTGTAGFTIRGLRAANTLQLWSERNNIAGNRYSDQIKARFGVYPSDAITDRAIYLGQKKFGVYNKSVFQTVPNGMDQLAGQNPFSSVGTKYGSPMGTGDDLIVDNYEVTEHGYFIVIFSIVPDVLYSSGMNRHLYANQLADFADPLLATVGDQEIYTTELWADDEPAVFGYTQRYSEYKYIDDKVSGLLRDGENLSAFALQRSFTSRPALGTSFLTIPTTFLDQVAAVSGSVSGFGAWVEFVSNFDIVAPLPAYSIPTLGTPMDTHTELVDLGGKRL